MRDMGKKAQQPPKRSNLWPLVLRVPGPNRPKCFSTNCGVPQRTQNARRCAFRAHGQGTKPQMPLLISAGVFMLSRMRNMGKKSQQPPKRSNLWPQVLLLHGPDGPKCFSTGCGVP